MTTESTSKASPDSPPRRSRGTFLAWLSPLAAVAAMLLFAIDADLSAALTVIPRWCYAVGGVLPAGWSILRRRRSRPVLLGLALWLVFVAACVEEPRSLLRGCLPAREPSSDHRRLCIVALNCGDRLGDLAPALSDHAPDLVLLQETPPRTVLEDWSRQLYGTDGAFLAGVDCSLLARGKLAPAANVPGDPYRHAIWTTVDGNQIRVASLRLKPQPVRFDYSNAACWREYRSIREAHRRELLGLATLLAASPDGGVPCIVGGDFNSPAHDATDGILTSAGLVDAFTIAGRGWGNTITDSFPFHRIDRIFLSDTLHPLSVTAHRTRFSDHRLVKCVVEITE